MRGDEIAMIEPQPAASIHHFVGGRRQGHRAAELAAEFEGQQHVFLLQRDIGKRDGGPFILDGKMPAVPLADVTLQQKDMLLALELGRKLGSPVPLAAAANEMMNACRGLGLDHRDFVTAHEVYRRLGGAT